MRFLLVFVLFLLTGCLIQPGPGVPVDDPPVGSPEVPPAQYLPCYPGAYYRKAASSFDQWTGIEGVITLPRGEIDPNRMEPLRPLDNFSIYMGGRASNQEVDAGLIWEITRDEQGQIDRVNRAWRPFWRVTTWANAPAQAQYYWYPGDRVRISVVVAGPGLLRLTVQDDHPTPEKVFSVDFPASQWGMGQPQQFKRVNAIDQVGNEGKPVQPTQAQILGAQWHEVWLLRGDERLPMVSNRFTDMRCPAGGHVQIHPLNPELGGEIIDLKGTM